MTNEQAAHVLEDELPYTLPYGTRFKAITIAISVLRGGHGERRSGTQRRDGKDRPKNLFYGEWERPCNGYILSGTDRRKADRRQGA